MPDRRSALLGILLFTMTASSFQIFAIAVLAVDIIDDLDISRTALGLLGSLNTLVGAISAPRIGRVTDRIGAKQATVASLAIGGIGLAIMAMSSTWVLLAVSALVSGIAQGWGNPATNALIAERIPSDGQGTATGIKQSGVQLGIFLGGFSLPGLALAVGWRGAMLGYAIVFGISAAVVAKVLQPSAPAEQVPATPGTATPETAAGGEAGVDLAPTASAGATADPASVPRFVWALSLYAFLYGTAGGAIGRFFPLWANEVVGLSTVVAGALVALGGLLGIVARIAAGQLAQERLRPSMMLSGLALIGGSYCVVLLATTTIGSWVLWPAAVLYSVGIGAWNAVAMLAVITAVPRSAAGRASGVVMLGFLGGLSLGSPAAGAIVDRFGTYQPVWAGGLLLALASAAVIHPRVAARTNSAPVPVTGGQL